MEIEIISRHGKEIYKGITSKDYEVLRRRYGTLDGVMINILKE